MGFPWVNYILAILVLIAIVVFAIYGIYWESANISHSGGSTGHTGFTGCTGTGYPGTIIIGGTTQKSCSQGCNRPIDKECIKDWSTEVRKDLYTVERFKSHRKKRRDFTQL